MFAAQDRVLTVPTPSQVTSHAGVTELQGSVAWNLQPPSFLVDLSTQGVKFDFGSNSSFNVHSTYIGRYEQQYLFGFHHLHALLGRDGRFNCQEVNNYDGRLDFYLKNIPPAQYIVPDLVRVGSEIHVDLGRLSDEAVVKLDGPMFFGSPIEPANWGMWLLNGLPSAYAFVASGQVGRFLCYAPADWQKQLLRLMGVEPDKIVDQKPWTTYYCPEIALHQYSMVDLIPDEIARAVFRNIASRFTKTGESKLPEKVFISRRSITQNLGSKYRALINEDHLAEALSRNGFKTVEPELLPFEDQVRIFSNAKVIVGLGGAAMFNAVFAKAGTKLVSIESTSVFALNHARLFSSLGLNYGFIFGEQDASGGRYPHNPWTIDVPRAIQAISRFA